MSAWRLGVEAARPRGAFEAAGDENRALSFVGKLLEWIPADVVVIFAAAVTAAEAEPGDAWSEILLIGGVVLAFVAVVGGAFQVTRSFKTLPSTVWRDAALASVAFAVWSATVPNSGWQDVELIADNPQGTVVACGVFAFLFALFAPKRP